MDNDQYISCNKGQEKTYTINLSTVQKLLDNLKILENEQAYLLFLRQLTHMINNPTTKEEYIFNKREEIIKKVSDLIQLKQQQQQDKTLESQQQQDKTLESQQQQYKTLESQQQQDKTLESQQQQQDKTLESQQQQYKTLESQQQQQQQQQYETLELKEKDFNKEIPVVSKIFNAINTSQNIITKGKAFLSKIFSGQNSIDNAINQIAELPPDLQLKLIDLFKKNPNSINNLNAQQKNDLCASFLGNEEAWSKLMEIFNSFNQTQKSILESQKQNDQDTFDTEYRVQQLCKSIIGGATENIPKLQKIDDNWFKVALEILGKNIAQLCQQITGEFSVDSLFKALINKNQQILNGQNYINLIEEINIKMQKNTSARKMNEESKLAISEALQYAQTKIINIKANQQQQQQLNLNDK